MRSILVLGLLFMAGCTMPAPEPGPDELPAALLLARPYPDLVVELDHAPELRPDAQAIHAMEDALERYTSKQRVIVRLEPEPLLSKGVDDRRGIVDAHRATADLAPTTPGFHGRGDVAVLHVLYIADRLDDHVIATTLAHEGVIAVFPETFAGIERLVDDERVPAAAHVETHALLHELGHAFGLVGEGIPMTQDRRAEGSGHSTNPASVMYHAVQVRDGLLTSGLSLRFDEHDIADMEAFRGVVREAASQVTVSYTHEERSALSP